MNKYLTRHARAAVVLFAGLVAVTSVAVIDVDATRAQPGAAPAGTAIAEYYWDTGVVIVSASAVSNWFVDSASASMTGPADVGAVLPQAGGLVSNNPFRVGELKFGGSFSYTDVNLGAVAATQLAPEDLNIFWKPANNDPSNSQPVVCIGLCTPGSGGDIAGDFDDSGSVGNGDLTLLLDGWGAAPGAGWTNNPPVNVGNASLTILLDDWGKPFPTLAAVAVPEPSTFVLLAVGGFALVGRRRRS